MRKTILLFPLLVLPLLLSCNNSNINMPLSPFADDHYQRIGMDGQYKIAESMSEDEFNSIKNYIKDEDAKDGNVASYHIQQENRDLKHAYFGNESSAISQCSLTSISENLNRYNNRVTIDDIVTNKEVQTANGGIQKTQSLSTSYTFDSNYYLEEFSALKKYQKRLKTKINNESEEVKQELDETEYTEDLDKLYDIFGLKPFTTRIKSHFVQTDKYKFELLGNAAVYGKTSDGKYLIKEGYSLFDNFSTTMGRTYKSVNNYFYEGLLDKIGSDYYFVKFRFYRELLILSKSFDGSSVPIIYLEKPVLVEFDETTYSDITYFNNETTDLPKYTQTIPVPSTGE